MEKWELIAPCHFGLEAVLKREITELGYQISRVQDGKVFFWGDARAVADANIFLRTAERIMIKVGSIHAESFEELFEGVRKLRWDKFIPKDGKFWVAKANSVRSKLFSPSDIQSITKKAVVDRLRRVYGLRWFPEDGASYPIRVSSIDDEALIGLDTTGISLHKRGYRKFTVKAPLSETLAAALLMLTPWKSDRILVDPFCGGGTFPIEAAMIAANQAPGKARPFQAQEWLNVIAKKCWQDAREEAEDLVDRQIDVDIQGYDLDAKCIHYAHENAKLAGVDSMIHFQQRPLSQLSHSRKYGFLIANPPYGERLDEQADLEALYGEIGDVYSKLDSWSMFLLTAYKNAEKAIGRKADKNRKVYNGMLKAYYYQFLGPAPHRNKKHSDIVPA